ncbi:MAG TPA: hypothetical protein DHV85_06015 [Candidatus Accumulibacter sp.]|nr:hypothetical protein [Accumulibacter sp.]
MLIVSETLLPDGLRHVLVHVTLSGAFPPAQDSADDVALLRAANRAMRRKQRGHSDSFLFVFAGQFDADKLQQAIAAYGFPDFSVSKIETDGDVDKPSGSDYEDLCTEVGGVVSQWLGREHPGAIALSSDEFKETTFWWSGVEHDDDRSCDWHFTAEAYAASLPDAHRARAATWLTVLSHSVEFAEMQYDCPAGLGSDRAAAWAATLCEWLHGFEAATGNRFNNFESEYAFELMPSEFYLGFEFARISGEELETICDQTGDDVDSLPRTALKTVTEEKRSELRGALASFFGGDSDLFWALYSAIWPKFNQPMSDALNSTLGTSDYEGLAELEAPWRFVSDGWSDEAEG